MVKIIRTATMLALLTGMSIAAHAQIKAYTVADAHSHNDYKNNIPFYRAYEKGFGSIEADVYAVNGQLMVAHDKKEISAKRSLKILYIDPLIEKFNRDPQRHLRLLIEIKEDYKAILPLVISELKPLEKYFAYDGHPGRLSIVMTGAVPPAAVMPNYPDWISFDVDHLDGFTAAQWKKIGLVSFPLSKYVHWNGKGVFNADEIKRIKGGIDSVHNAGKKVRFYETPDTKSSWLAMLRLGVDVIGTDDIEGLGNFLNRKEKSEYKAPEPYVIYHPSYKSDGTVKKVKNIILCIGDGMGLSQLYATYSANRGQLNIFQMLNMGFSVTYSADAYITDSAAGATAFASGQKTNDRAIGVDPAGKPLRSLADYSADAGKKTADIVVCELTDATPAAFYAHDSERSHSTNIANQIVSSPVDIFLGSAYKDFTQPVDGQTPIDKMKQRGYTIIRNFDDFLNTPATKILALMDDSVTRPKMDGRGNYLPLALKKVTQTFKSAPNGFFMMIEGSQIDHGGHTNNLKQVITENSDFDRMVGDALRFADEDGETLVIVTADHETGGLTLLDGNIAKGYVWGDFSTNDHTGTPVPIFAYGPHSLDFRGVFNNTEIFNKLKALIK
ncbi:alkaline phosphatase [Mucilaginibacter ginsenosidivorax]|uniref:Alkaline phosphatase n=1 Tax=Mucilaginibacter ginsenosidivorax TaxID=862126 RepID=A0A5B8W593_9SPHI|nr:alkaline phosphatase [Mucilaginibacter ginsenosidivorax]QEC78719.1 alkaline phosphatase [Mucilaginibacter ginsenosidivorax]